MSAPKLKFQPTIDLMEVLTHLESTNPGITNKFIENHNDQWGGPHCYAQIEIAISHNESTSDWITDDYIAVSKWIKDQDSTIKDGDVILAECSW